MFSKVSTYFSILLKNVRFPKTNQVTANTPYTIRFMIIFLFCLIVVSYQFRTYAIAFVRYVPQDGFGFRALRVSGSDGRMFRRVPVPCVYQVRMGVCSAGSPCPACIRFGRAQRSPKPSIRTALCSAGSPCPACVRFGRAQKPKPSIRTAF